MADWMRRLFHQRRGSVAPMDRGQDWGFTGQAALVVIDDEYRLADIREACTPRERFTAANGWLLKLARNGERAFEDLGDPAIQDALDNTFDRLASMILVEAGGLRDALREILISDHDPSGDRDEDAEVEHLKLGMTFDWPEGRAS
jgi:hypothetical protein